MQGFCLCCLSLLAVDGSRGLFCGAPPFCSEVELQRPIHTREVVLFSAAIKCAMYYVAQKHTCYKAHFVVHCVSSVS